MLSCSKWVWMKVKKVNAVGGAHNARAEVLLFTETAQTV